MKIILCDINRNIIDEWLRAFDYKTLQANIDIFHGKFQDIPIAFDGPFIICAAGNSYGQMSGGIDLAIARAFPEVESNIQDLIELNYSGELPVGSCQYSMLAERYKPFRGVLYVPTMRSPMIINGTDNVYQATRAALNFMNECGEDMGTLVIPGFGGSCGKVPPPIIANSMRLAYDMHVVGTTARTDEEMYRRNRLIAEVVTGKITWPSKA